MKKIFFLFLFPFALLAQTKNIAIIPKPQSLQIGKSKFTINDKTKIVVPSNAKESIPVAEQLALRIKILKTFSPEIVNNVTNNSIVFQTNKGLSNEAYELTVKPTSIIIEASSAVGHFYGLQTLFQLLPSEIFGASQKQNLELSVPECIIKDAPRFGYRGVMLDVGRHFFSVDFIKKFIDILAMHKLNNLHWHLTEDQGWRIEIKKYPKLTEIGSIRKETMLGHYRDQKFDGKPYGGFYTQDQIREIVAYSQTKFVNIVPEIEMPGHALAAIAAYPELGCTGEQYEVGTKWGVEERVYCPSEKTFSFLEDVLTEVIDLFPSPYIHIGGDECPKEMWKKSSFCQDLIKKENLKDEHGLQSYFIQRIDKFVTSKGRKIIGWDEILEGGLSPNATVMSWRGEEGGIEAAKQKHDVIMTPNNYLYLDYYQSDPANEPIAIGGFLPLDKTYSYEPLSSELSEDEAKYIKGVQANLWTEYIATPEYAEYMLLPRAIALAEIAWTKDKTKNYQDFSNRLIPHFERLDFAAINYSKAFYDVNFKTEKNSLGLPVLAISGVDSKYMIRYTLDGTLPNEKSLLYNPKDKIKINGDQTISAATFTKEGKKIGNVNTKSFLISKSTGKNYKLSNPPKKYFGGEDFALTNGIRGDIYKNDPWVGFAGTDFEITIDLAQKTNFSSVSLAFLSAYSSWILPAQDVEIWISDDDKNYKSIKKLPLGKSPKVESFVQQLNISVDNQNARYVKIKALNFGNLPAGHPGEGKPSWLFVDEISIK
jgi:hexosaminidase